MLCFLLMGCHNKDSVSAIESINVDVKNNVCENQSAFSDFDFVKLDFVENAALSSIGKVVSYKDKLYILTLYDPNIFIFSSTGEYITSINRGQGPGEINFVSDIEVYNEKLYALDLYRTIKEYDLEGRFIRDEYKFEHPYFSMNHTEDGVLLFDPNLDKNSDYYLSYLSDNSDNKYLKKNKYLSDLLFSELNFYKNGFISWPLCDTVYTMKDKVPQAEYIVTFNEKNFFEKKFQDKVTMDELIGMAQDKTMIRWLRDVMPYHSGIYFSFSYDCTYFVKYEKGKTKIYKKFIDGLPDVVEQLSVGVCDNGLVYVFTAEELLAYKANNGLNGNAKIQSLYDSVENEEDNPVLVFAKLD